MRSPGCATETHHLRSTRYFPALFVLTSTDVFHSDCSSGPTPKVTQSNERNRRHGHGDLKAPTAGTYYINAAFGTRTVKGSAAPSPSTVQCAFSTTGLADSTRALDLVKE